MHATKRDPELDGIANTQVGVPTKIQGGIWKACSVRYSAHVRTDPLCRQGTARVRAGVAYNSESGASSTRAYRPRGGLWRHGTRLLASIHYYRLPSAVARIFPASNSQFLLRQWFRRYNGVVALSHPGQSETIAKFPSKTALTRVTCGNKCSTPRC